MQPWSKSVSVSIDCVDACFVEAADQLPSRRAKQHASLAAGEVGAAQLSLHWLLLPPYNTPGKPRQKTDE